MINRILYNLTARLPCRLISLDSGPYLERYYVGQWFGVTFYLHRFVSSDVERHMHNHPWGWGRALVLSGGYTEEFVTDLCPHAGGSGAILKRRKVRWWNKVNGNHFHRISDAKPGTWTLFAHGPRVVIDGFLKGWGFLESPDGELTIFRPYLSAGHTHRRWWLTAPAGRDAGRAPL